MSVQDSKPKKKYKLLEYLRVSTLKQKNEVTIETQKRENKIYKKLNSDNFEIVRTYKDDGKSGFKFGIEERPGFNKLLDDLYSDEEIDGIFSYDLDRIGRDATELQILGKDFLNQGKVIWTTTKGFLSQDTPEGELIYGLFSLLTQFDGNTIKRKLKAGRERKYEENIKKGLPKTYGFGRKKKVVPNEIKQKMIKWYEKGYGFKEIQNRMKKIPYQIFDKDKNDYIDVIGFKLSTATIGKRLRDWGVEIRDPKYAKPKKEEAITLESLKEMMDKYERQENKND